MDIGSGSVTVSVIHSDPRKKNYSVVWRSQGWLLQKDVQGADDTAKHILSLATDLVLKFSTEGISALKSFDPNGTIEVFQVSVSAPWSYTITKRVTFEKDTPFKVDSLLIDELLTSAETTIAEELRENERAHELGLSIVSKVSSDIVVNGYKIDHLTKEKANNISLSHTSIVIQNYLLENLRSVHESLLPSTKLEIYSYMIQIFSLIRSMHPELKEYCLINQTMEAVEVGIVRNGTLTYCTHEPYGTAHFVRDVAAATGTPVGEVLGVVQANTFKKYLSHFSSEKQSAIQSIIERYQTTITQLLQQTGDDFLIPNIIYMHSNSGSYNFFKKHAEQGAKVVTRADVLIKNTDSELILRNIVDTASVSQSKTPSFQTDLVSGHFFHTLQDTLHFRHV